MLSEQYLTLEFTRSEFDEYFQSLVHYNMSPKHMCVALKLKFGTQKKDWTLKELEREFEVDKRTIFRYIAEFTKLGIMFKKWCKNGQHFKYYML